MKAIATARMAEPPKVERWVRLARAREMGGPGLTEHLLRKLVDAGLVREKRIGLGKMWRWYNAQDIEKLGRFE